MSAKFTNEAQKFWDSIPEEIQTKLLNNVFCVRCKLTTIVNFTGKVKKGDLILEGVCKTCGGRVARLIEGGHS